MAKASPATDKCINRRAVLKGGTALAAGSALLRGGYAEAQPRANRLTALFAYVGAFTTPERKGHGGGINEWQLSPLPHPRGRPPAPPAQTRGRSVRRRVRCTWKPIKARGGR